MLVSLVVLIASIANNLFMNKDFLQKFANRLKQLRKRKGLTQDDISTEQISRSMISLVELARTDITLTKVKAIADSLGVSVSELLDFE
jgi:transcriptional regulator with XRE-family HTH domain